MSKRMGLTLEMPPMARTPLYQRTVDSWAQVVNPKELETAIRERLLMPRMNEKALEFGAPKPDFGCWILSTWSLITQSPIDMLWRPTEPPASVPDDSASVIIGDKHLSWLLFSSVGQLDWNHPEILVLMCLATYRALVRKSYGTILGLNHNITIAGAMATCLNLNVKVNLE